MNALVAAFETGFPPDMSRAIADVIPEYESTLRIAAETRVGGILASTMSAGANANSVCIPAAANSEFGISSARLTPEQKLSLEGYTGNDEDGILSFDINGAWRTGYTDSAVIEETKKLEAALANSRLTKDITVYRIVPAEVDQFKTLDAGDFFTDPAFVSTTGRRNVLDNVADDVGLHKDDALTLEIRLPKGARALDVNQHLGRHNYHYQKEIILPRNGRFEVLERNDRHILLAYEEE